MSVEVTPEQAERAWREIVEWLTNDCPGFDKIDELWDLVYHYRPDLVPEEWR